MQCSKSHCKERKETPTGDRHLMLVRMGVDGFVVAIGGGVVGVVGVMGVVGLVVGVGRVM